MRTCSQMVEREQSRRSQQKQQKQHLFLREMGWLYILYYIISIVVELIYKKQTSSLVFACCFCCFCCFTSRCHIAGKSIPLPLVTGVFRAVTKCHCGPTKGRESPLSTEGRQEAVWIYKSIPYCLQIHSTALGGNIFELRFTPKRASLHRFSPSHL